MGVALPWQWFTQLGGHTKEHSQFLSYFVSPLLALGAVVLTHNASPRSYCLFEHLLEIPCPGCGIISSLYAILSGELGAAWSFNPCGFVVFASLLGQSLVTGLEFLSLLKRGARLRFALQSNIAVASFLIFAWVVHLGSIN